MKNTYWYLAALAVYLTGFTTHIDVYSTQQGTGLMLGRVQS